MASEGGVYTPPKLHKDRSEYKANIQPGEPWTFMQSVWVDVPNGRRKVEPGDVVSDWWDTGEPGRLFRVVKTYPDAVETVYMGFAKFPGSIEVAD